MSGKEALGKDLSRLLSRVRFSLIYIVDLFLGSGFLSSFLQVIPNLLLEFPEDMTYWLGWRLMVSRGCATPLLPGAGVVSCKLQSDISEAVNSLSRSWELREQAFDDGNNHVQMKNLLVLFLIGSRFHLIFAFKNNSSPNPAATVVHATGHQNICFCRSISEVEKAQLLNPLMNSAYSRWICILAISSVCVMFIWCVRVEWSTESAATLFWYVP